MSYLYYRLNGAPAETTFASADLEGSRAFDLNEIARMVPGLVNLEQGPAARGNNSNFILRGLNANSSVNSRP